MIGAIPNPTRTITIPATYDSVVSVMDNISNILTTMRVSGYDLKERHTLLGQWKFTKTEFLSLGVEILVMLEDVGEKTKITVEIQRVLGAFDSWVEVHNANKHLEVIFKAISFGINPPSEDKVVEIQKQQETENQNNGMASILVGGVIMFVMLAYIL
jgi:hypothetical protein